MTPRATFERVYAALKEQLFDGRFAPGCHLEPAHLSEELNASITPVRDALQRLVGERLVDASPGDGFRSPVVTELGLRQLYSWNNSLAQLALRNPQTPSGVVAGLPAIGPDQTAQALTSAAAELFSSIARRSGNAEHLAAVNALNGRLSTVRLKEVLFLDGVGAELASLFAESSAGDPRLLRQSLNAYHRRRIRVVDRLVAALADQREQ